MARNDEQIKRDVVDQLYWDTGVNAADVQVSVHDGVVELNGKVQSYSARTAAFADAWAVPGVTQVIDHINVEYATESADDELQAACDSALSLNPDLDAAAIDCNVDQGVVTLRGSVDAYWKKAYAEELVSRIRGVVLVSNHLGVVPSRAPIDQDIAEDIVAALDRNMLVDSSQVDVRVENGIVTLSGSVANWPARMAARNAAARTFGVVDVIDQLEVKGR